MEYVWSLVAGRGLLRIIGQWILLKKAGKPGWHAIIPFLNFYQEYEICWRGSKGILTAVLLVVLANLGAQGEELSQGMTILATVLAFWVFTLEWRESFRLARSFGGGILYGLFLFFFGGIGRIILGLTGQYRGNYRR